MAKFKGRFRICLSGITPSGKSDVFADCSNALIFVPADREWLFCGAKRSARYVYLLERSGSDSRGFRTVVTLQHVSVNRNLEVAGGLK